MKINRPIKILYVIHSSIKSGAGIALLNLVDNLPLSNFNPLFVLSEKGFMSEALIERKLPFFILKNFLYIYPPIRSMKDYLMFIPRIIRALLYNLFAVLKLKKIATNFGADLIHTNIGPEHTGFYVARLMNIPHIWHIREYQDLDFGWLPFPSYDSFVNKLNSKNNYPVAVSSAIYKHFNLNENAIVIHDGVMKKKQAMFITSKEKYFLFVGRFEEAKGLQQLIETFKDFCCLDLEYILKVAGNGDIKDEMRIKQLIQNYKLTSRVELLGFRHDIHNLMSRATALIVPSRCEGFGFITVEAMFNGCLVIGNSTGGTKEILEREQLGLLYLEKDELLRAMLKVKSQGINFFYQTIVKAQTAAIELYSIEKHSQSVYNLYKKAIGL